MLAHWGSRLFSLLCAVLLLSSTQASLVWAQLEVTEVMFNPLSSGDTAWEWIEVRNLGGAAVDLNGAYAARLGDQEVAGPAIDGSATNTVIPAGGTAIIYDAFLSNGNPNNFNDQQFRDAWGLGEGVPVIGASLFPPLTNGGTNFAFWANFSDYSSNLEFNSDSNQFEVASLNNTLFDLDYTGGNGFPGSSNGTSMRWSGNGSYRTGGQWALSTIGETGVVTSTEVSISGATNSTSDVGNPGIVAAGPAPAGLLITEIMFNPRSPETSGNWEWVEIYNNTAGTINFASTNYYLDDDDGNALEAPNITSGIIGQGETAILFNDDQLELTDLQGAWDPNGTRELNFIGVTEWPGFANSNGDLVALWDDQTAYETDEGNGTTTGAVAAVLYDDNPGDATNPWPQDDGNGSIYLTDLAADANVGANWLLSFPGVDMSYNASALTGSVVIHPGGDVGSPGTFEAQVASTVDLDLDGDVDGNDFLLIQTTNPSLTAQWQLEYGGGVGSLSAVTAVPEPGSCLLLGLALVLSAQFRPKE